jgi:hypothetical protein
MKPAYSKLKKSVVSKKKKIITRKVKTKLSKALKMALVVVFSIIVLGAFSLYKYFEENYAWAFEGSSFKKENSTYSYVLISLDNKDSASPQISRIYFIIADKNANKLLIHNISPQLKVDMPGRFGEETLANIARLSSLDNKDYVENISLAILKIFKFHVNNYVVIDAKAEKYADSILVEGMPSAFYNPVDLRNIKSDFRTDYKLKELYELSKFADSLPEDRKVIEQVSGNEKISEDYSELNFDSVMNNEKITISVVNSTGREGFATLVADVIQNQGGRIVGITSTDKEYQNSFIITDDPNSAAVKLIADIFRITDIKTKEQVSNLNISEIDRSEVVIVLGFDTASWLY